MKKSFFISTMISLFLSILLISCATSNKQEQKSDNEIEENYLRIEEAEEVNYLHKGKKDISLSMREIPRGYEPIEEPVSHNSYDTINENKFISTAEEPVSTFSIDVDNASYSIVRNYLEYNNHVPENAVRIEEMINYFDYNYPSPVGDDVFSVITELSDAPWNNDHKLLHIGLQGKKLDYSDLKPSNLVFLLDVSGSMDASNKLPLLKDALKLLLNELSEKDKVSIVVYAGAAGVILEPTSATEKDKIISALDNLDAGGSTAGGEGIVKAYELCQKNLIQDGNNRIILATDGDFNVGVSSNSELVDLITEYRTNYNIYLTICGFGMGNYKDDKMKQISNAGNGNYFYIDSKKEANKVFVKDLRANMFTIAKDVKIQINFDPQSVAEYRLIGYENRVMQNEDFDDDTKDAGELGAGHTVTAIYEIITKSNNSDDLATIKLRYKPINSNNSILIQKKINRSQYVNLSEASKNFRFSASVAAFGMLLRKSKYLNNYKCSDILSLTEKSLNNNDEYQTEFLNMVRKYSQR